jgi:DNA-directed RNA polymerase subunit alpha
MELPGTLEVDRESLTATYGRFIAEPFERGFGTSVGNSLRRVLLSSLMGSAVTQIKIRGAQHEFTTIEGVIEDVTDIVLNVKSLIVRNHSEATRVITLESNKAGVLTGADVETDADVESHQQRPRDRDVDQRRSVHDGNGRRKRSRLHPSTEHSVVDHEIGIIPIDAVFSPVTRVRYQVEDTRVGQKTNYDRLILEVWTDGSVSPEMALIEAAKILRKHLNPFVQYRELGPSHLLGRSWRVGFGRSPARSQAEHEAFGIEAVGAGQQLPGKREHRDACDLVQRTEDQLLEVRNFGDTTLNEVREKLAQYGLHLGMRVPSASL